MPLTILTVSKHDFGGIQFGRGARSLALSY